MTQPADRHSHKPFESAPITSSSSSSSSFRASAPPPPPRVYVPLSHSDSSLPTYAVLEFVGFSSPPSTMSMSMAPLHTPSHLQISSSTTLPSHNTSASLSLPPLSFTPNLLISPRSETPPFRNAAAPTPQIVQLLDSPPPSPPSSAIERAPLRSAEPPTILSIAANSAVKKLPMAESLGSVSISQNQRETIVHTNSSNFKDVVRQLTGASSQDQDLMPVTLPARLANRVSAGASTGAISMVSATSAAANNDSSSSSSSAAVAATSMPRSSDLSCSKPSGADQQLGLRKAPLKLHERRKALRNLERLSTTAIASAGASFRSEMSSSSSSPVQNCGVHVNMSPAAAGYCVSPGCSVSSAPAPSPVTPLASDFERFCNATTPTAGGHQVVCSPREAAVSCSPRYAACSPRFATNGAEGGGGGGGGGGVYCGGGGGGRMNSARSPRHFEDGGGYGIRGSSPRMEEAGIRGGSPMPPPHFSQNQQYYQYQQNAAKARDERGEASAKGGAPVLLNLFPESPVRSMQ